MLARVCHLPTDSRCLLRQLAAPSLTDVPAACEACGATFDDLDQAAEAVGGQLRRGPASSFVEEDACLQAQAAVLHLSAEPGNTAALEIPGHTVYEQIGRGGMGTVYRAMQSDLDREVAVKVLLAKRAKDIQQLTSRFEREAQVTAKLDHPSIVPIYAIGRDGQGRCFYTMRLVRGRSLEEVLRLAQDKAEGWNLSRALGVLVRICQTVAFAHGRRVVHRDLKPANVMVGELGEVYVLDWGLAKAAGQADIRDIRLRVEDESAAIDTLAIRDLSDSTVDRTPEEPPLMTMDGAVLGTPAYMPPEQASGQIEHVDHHSDIYSLGAILYHLLVGHAPYALPDRKVTSHQLLRWVIEGSPPTIAGLARKSPPELISICERAMARERGQRYRTALEMSQDLQAFLDGRVVKAHQTGAWVEARKWVMRNRAIAGTLFLAVALGITGLATNAWLQSRANRDLADANRQTNEALEREAELAAREAEAAQAARQAAASERQGRLQAQKQLADSYANFGEQEVAQKQFHFAALWFTKAAELTADPEIAHAHRMRAMQFGNHAMNPVSAWFDREHYQKHGFLDFPLVNQFRLDASHRYLLAKSERFGHTKVFDLHAEDQGVWSGGTFHAAAFAPEGGLIAVSAKPGEVQLRRLADTEVVEEVPVEPADGRITALEFSPDGSLLFIGANPARIWQVRENRFLAGRYPLNFPASGVVFSPALDQVLVLENYTRRVQLFPVGELEGPHQELLSAAFVWQDLPEQFRAGVAQLSRVMQSADGHGFRSGNDYEPFPLFDPHGNTLRLLAQPRNSVHGFVLEPAGRWLVYASGTGLVRQCLAQPLRPYRFLPLKEWALPLFSHDGSRIVPLGTPYFQIQVGPAKTELLRTQIYNVATLSPVGAGIDPQGTILGGAFSPDDRVLALVCGASQRSEEAMFAPDGRAGNVQFWDVATGTRIGTPVPMPSEPWAVAWHPSRPAVVVVCGGGETLKCDVAVPSATLLAAHKNRREPATMSWYPGGFPAGGVTFDPRGELVLSHVAGGLTCLDFETGRQLYHQAGRWIYRLFVRGETVVCTSQGGRPGVLSLRTGEELGQVVDITKGKTGRFSDDGHFVISGEQLVTVLNYETRQETCPRIVFGLHAYSDFVPRTPWLITTNRGSRQQCRVEFHDRRTGRPVAPAIEFAKWAMDQEPVVSFDGQYAALQCLPYGIAIIDLHSLHVDPRRGLEDADLMLLAEINASATVRDGRLVDLDETEWLTRWIDFRQHHPDFHRSGDQFTTAQLIQDHRTRAHELEVEVLPAAAAYHRGAAAQRTREPEIAN